MSHIRWPVAADYDESIQNPHINFADPELKGGELELDKFGSPAVRSGNFASVYMLKTAKRKLAIRCFLREVADQQERYAAISQDLLGLNLPYTVNFEYVKKGIKVEGEWFPILIMDWCDGQLLDEYLETNLATQHKVRRLADKWYEMSVVLRKQGIAHGDLQHGNVMLHDDEIKLIDYDGMFVPRLAGRQSNELGLEHYQHPARSETLFGRGLDNFSHWVIYTTLVALGEDSALWRFVRLQDKHLIFSKQDFEAPHESPIFEYLKRHANPTIQTYATTVENLLQYPVDKIPDFNPDKPVMHPPQFKIEARVSAGAQPVIKRESAGADKGYLFEEKPRGDKGGLFDAEKGQPDKGGLYDSVPDANEKLTVTNPSGTARTVKEPSAQPNQLKNIAIAGASVVVLGGAAFAAWTNFSAPHKDGDSAKNMVLMGITDSTQGSQVEARRRFREVIDLPNVSPKLKSAARTSLALSYLEEAGTTGDRTQLDEARKYLTEATKEDKENSVAYFALGHAYEIQKNKQEALKNYKRAKALEKDVKMYKDAYETLSKQP